MDCVGCSSGAVTERPDLTAQGYRRYRCRDCDQQFNERSDGVLNCASLPSDIIAFVVFCRLRYRLTLRDLSEIMLLRGFTVSHESIRRWEAKLLPVMGEALRKRRHGNGRSSGQSWYADETYLKVHGRWCYLYRAIDRDGNLIDTMLSPTRDMKAARRFVSSPDPADPGINRTLAAAAKSSVPVNLAASGRLDKVAGLASRNPDTVLVVDHLGLQQPFHPPAPAEPWANLPKVLALASHPNIRIKISGACTLSHEPYPYNDIWDPVLKVIDAFGIDRCMWGTDWTRATELLTYEQGVESFRATKRLSDSNRSKLMGGTLEKVYKWHR